MKKLRKNIFNFDNILVILMGFIMHKNLHKIAHIKLLLPFLVVIRTTREPLTFTLKVTPFCFLDFLMTFLRANVLNCYSCRLPVILVFSWLVTLFILQV